MGTDAFVRPTERIEACLEAISLNPQPSGSLYDPKVTLVVRARRLASLRADVCVRPYISAFLAVPFVTFGTSFRPRLRWTIVTYIFSASGRTISRMGMRPNPFPAPPAISQYRLHLA